MRRQENRREKFCSQLVARVLQEAHVLPFPPEGPPCNEYLPRDFGLMWGGTKEFTLAAGKLGRLHMVRRPKDTWTGLSLR